ncbi:FecR family protein [Flavobacterium sp. FlaQc-48]|uniref:FecR family protein n=1 Tax=Flavobacterium sp. FlaQc-48 TaxID=3374181 RepID=UPI003756EDA9
MLNIDKIISASRQIASSLLKGKNPTEIDRLDFFTPEEKQDILKEFTDKEKSAERNYLKSQIDSKEDWKIIKSKIEVPVRKMYWSYAAAAVIGLFGIGYYFSTSTTNTPKERIEQKIVSIPAGSNKAALTLEDGTVVLLEEGKTFNKSNAHSKGSEIYYNDEQDYIAKKTAYNYLTIPRGAQFFVMLSDGTKVWLNSESKIKYPVNFVDGNPRDVELVYGEAYFEVSPSTLHKGSKFKVVTGEQQIEVLGTQFNIKAYQDEDDIYTTLVEGSIAHHLFKESRKLVPGEQSVLNKQTNLITVKKVETQYETGWKDGVFSFDDKTLKEIMVVLSRWYDVNIVFENKELESIKFNGQIKKSKDLKEILDLIKNTHFINAYEIKNKTILLKK